MIFNLLLFYFFAALIYSILRTPNWIRRFEFLSKQKSNSSKMDDFKKNWNDVCDKIEMSGISSENIYMIFISIFYIVVFIYFPKFLFLEYKYKKL